MLGERIKLQFEEEQDAGRRRLARGQLQDFADEQEAGRNWAERACVRLEEEQVAGRRTAARTGR